MVILLWPAFILNLALPIHEANWMPKLMDFVLISLDPVHNMTTGSVFEEVDKQRKHLCTLIKMEPKPTCRPVYTFSPQHTVAELFELIKSRYLYALIKKWLWRSLPPLKPAFLFEWLQFCETEKVGTIEVCFSRIL